MHNPPTNRFGPFLGHQGETSHRTNLILLSLISIYGLLVISLPCAIGCVPLYSRTIANPLQFCEEVKTGLIRVLKVFLPKFIVEIALNQNVCTQGLAINFVVEIMLYYLNMGWSKPDPRKINIVIIKIHQSHYVTLSVRVRDRHSLENERFEKQSSSSNIVTFKLICLLLY